jgi:hypothetical protein
VSIKKTSVQNGPLLDPSNEKTVVVGKEDRQLGGAIRIEPDGASRRSSRGPKAHLPLPLSWLAAAAFVFIAIVIFATSRKSTHSVESASIAPAQVVRQIPQSATTEDALSGFDQAFSKSQGQIR